MLALKMEEGAMSQRIQGASRNGKRQENSALLEPSEGTEPYQHLDFSPRGPILNIVTSRTVR